MEKRGNLRMLDVLLGNSAESNSDTIFMSIDKLQPGGYQPRYSITDNTLDEMVETIREVGIINPITVRKNKGELYEILAGERRWRAAKLAGLKEVPIIVRDISNEGAAALALIENLQRENLNPIEEALGYQKLIDEFGLTHEQIAKKIGKSRATVTNVMRLLKLKNSVRDLLRQGCLEMGHARALLSLSDDDQIQAAQTVAARNLSVRETENLVQRIKYPPARPEEPPSELISRAETLSQQLSNRISNNVKINVNNKGEGRVVINFSSLDEIDWLVGKLA